MAIGSAAITPFAQGGCVHLQGCEPSYALLQGHLNSHSLPYLAADCKSSGGRQMPKAVLRATGKCNTRMSLRCISHEVCAPNERSWTKLRR